MLVDILFEIRKFTVPAFAHRYQACFPDGVPKRTGIVLLRKGEGGRNAAIAKREEVRFLVLVQISHHLPVEDMDIGAALENAHNAFVQLSPDAERFIELKFIQHKNSLCWISPIHVLGPLNLTAADALFRKGRPQHWQSEYFRVCPEV